MAKQRPITQRDIEAADRHDKTPIQAYCPKCHVYYPATSNAHAGH